MQRGVRLGACGTTNDGPLATKRSTRWSDLLSLPRTHGRAYQSKLLTWLWNRGLSLRVRWLSRIVVVFRFDCRRHRGKWRRQEALFSPEETTKGKANLPIKITIVRHPKERADRHPSIVVLEKKTSPPTDNTNCASWTHESQMLKHHTPTSPGERKSEHLLPFLQG